MTKKMDAALDTLVRRRDDLRSGLNSVSAQADHIDDMRAELAHAESRMEQDSIALDEIERAIEHLGQS